MSKNNNKSTKPVTAMSQKAELARKVAELQAKMAELENAKAELQKAESEIAENARIELEALLNTLPGLTGLVDLATVGRCCISLAKNGHLKGEKSGPVGERKARVVLTAEQQAEADKILLDETIGGPTIRAKAVMAKFDVSFPTAYNRIKELTAKPAASIK